ncbi:response regulator transcription factor [Hugenholtzia roseola]|uniref:response regulator transcription factor n=1 Tax=Hugenholtzia roseola TaxID=1002 RepID=UPI00041A34EB|nr:response regulator transcription factor [Hugenholtzia roseola]
MNKILLAEDDHNLGQILKEFLVMKNYNVTLCRDGQSAFDTFRDNRNFDICIFDVMMPVMDGFTLAAKVREIDRTTPIIFLTAKGAKEDRIQGLQIGADDYLPKPFSMEELLLRIQAVLRRTTFTDAPPLKRYELGNLIFDYDGQILRSAKKEFKLTSKESELLRLLCEFKNKTLERTYALEQIWGEDNYFNARSMDVYITKLRKYLHTDESVRILNVHGTGFKLVELLDVPE